MAPAARVINKFFLPLYKINDKTSKMLCDRYLRLPKCPCQMQCAPYALYLLMWSLHGSLYLISYDALLCGDVRSLVSFSNLVGYPSNRNTVILTLLLHSRITDNLPATWCNLLGQTLQEDPTM